MRGILLAALAALSSIVVPAEAVVSPRAHEVYEIYRVKPGGPSAVAVDVYAWGDGRPTAFTFADLTPSGAGYTPYRWWVGMFGLDDTQWRVYGLPQQAPQPPCPDESLCGTPPTDDGELFGTRQAFSPRSGHRYLVAGPKGATFVFVSSTHWKVKRTTLALRTAVADRSESAGVVSGEGTYETFRSATIAAGAYGSSVYAEVPCDAGAWTLASATAETYGPYVCGPNAPNYDFATTTGKRTWTLSGPTAGYTDSALRMVVLDHPKRR